MIHPANTSTTFTVPALGTVGANSNKGRIDHQSPVRAGVAVEALAHRAASSRRFQGHNHGRTTI